MRKWIREYLLLTSGMLCLLAARSSLADHYFVPSGSMARTLFAGDRVVVDKQAYGLRVPFTLWKLRPGAAPARGDVVIFDSPADGTRLIKRVVAVPGDLVEVRDGRVLINGAESSDGRRVVLSLESGGGPDLAPTRVPRGHVVVLGDARGNSHDSRFFGFVREDEIYARAVGVYFRAEEGFVWLPL
jgi:signal peptidase I